MICSMQVFDSHLFDAVQRKVSHHLAWVDRLVSCKGEVWPANARNSLWEWTIDYTMYWGGKGIGGWHLEDMQYLWDEERRKELGARLRG